MATTTMKIMRGLAGKDVTVYNDKCVNGDRSVKVRRWGKADYKIAKKALEAAGLKVVLTKHIAHDCRHPAGQYEQIRLRVTE